MNTITNIKKFSIKTRLQDEKLTMHIFKPHQAIDLIASYLPNNPIIIEAGAFDGTDTIKMAQRWPQGSIHAFEPVPELFEKLIYKTKNFPNIHCYQLALSDTNGSATFYVSEKSERPGIPSQVGSLLKPKDRLAWSPLIFPKTIHVQTITAETWAHENSTNQIDCLWLDAQGHELSILRAAQNMLKHVRVIHTEVGFIEGYEGQPCYEQIKSWLEEREFQEIGRDFENTTDWFFGNTLFVQK